MPSLTVPPPIGPDDAVAVAAPASTVDVAFPEKFEHALACMREDFGLDVVEYPTARRSAAHLLEHPEARAADVHRAFADDDVAALVSVIGGNDQVRILDHLERERLGADPTRFVGFSDNTVLCAALFDAGVVSYYGGGVLVDFGAPAMHPYTERYLRRALFERHLGELEPAPAFSDDTEDWADPGHLDRERAFEPHPGREWCGPATRVEGTVWGGCLEVVETLLAADRCVPSLETFEEVVLALETSEELPSPDAVRRVVLALGERGILGAVRGLMVGAVTARSHRLQRDRDARAAYRASIREAIDEALAWYAPELVRVYGVAFGHAAPRAPIPIGGRVELDASAGTIAFP
ncbi:MAG: S66 peptidase family protein [Halobacteriales archaeon]